MPFRVRDGIRRNPQAEVDLLQGALVSGIDQSKGPGRKACGRNRGMVELTEFLFDPAYQAGMIQAPGGRDNHVFRNIALSKILLQLRALDPGDRLFCAENRPSQRMVLPEVLDKQFMDQIIGRVLHHLDFFEDNTSFLVDRFGIEAGIHDEIGDEIDGKFQVFVQHLDTETGTLLGGKSVEVASDGIHGPGNFFRGTAPGPLEEHVLNKMSDAILFPCLASRSAAKPDPQGHGPDVRERLRDNRQSVLQYCFFDFFHRAEVDQTVTQGSGR